MHMFCSFFFQVKSYIYYDNTFFPDNIYLIKYQFALKTKIFKNLLLTLAAYTNILNSFNS